MHKVFMVLAIAFGVALGACDEQRAPTTKADLDAQVVAMLLDVAPVLQKASREIQNVNVTCADREVQNEMQKISNSAFDYSVAYEHTLKQQPPNIERAYLISEDIGKFWRRWEDLASTCR